MITFLRTTSTKGLAAAALAAVGLMAGGAMMATGAAGTGSKPVAKPLAKAISDSVGTKVPFEGVTARVVFTNQMLDSSGASGAIDPLIGGGSGRLWADPNGKIRIELQSDAGGGDAQIFTDGKTVWFSDGALNQAWMAEIPAYSEKPNSDSKPDQPWPPSIKAIAGAIRSLSGDAVFSAPKPSNIGGRPAYTVTISPRDTSGLLAGGQVSWDAANGAPLGIALLAKGNSSPVLQIQASSVEFGPVDQSAFDVSPPANAKKLDLNSIIASVSAKEASAKAKGRSAKRKPPVTGLKAVQKSVSFKLSAPAVLAGRKRDKVMLVGHGKDAGAIISYGTGMSAILVTEMPEDAKSSPSTGTEGVRERPREGSFSLPTEKIAGVDAMKLATPLGTLISFSRDGIRYIVAGSVTGETATSAASGL